MAGELAPEADLPTEAQLSERFGVSRTVIREAIQQAAARGLVTVRHGVGAQVTANGRPAFAQAMILALSRSGCTMGDVLAFRKLVEPEICAAAAQAATSRDIAELTAAVDAYEHGILQDDRQQAQQAHLQFHQTVWQAAHNPVLTVLMDPLSRMILLSTLVPWPGPVIAKELLDIETHREMLTCMRAGDTLGSRRAMMTDLSNVSMEVDWSQPLTPEWIRSRLGQ